MHRSTPGLSSRLCLILLCRGSEHPNLKVEKQIKAAQGLADMQTEVLKSKQTELEGMSDAVELLHSKCSDSNQLIMQVNQASQDTRWVRANHFSGL